MKKIFLRVLKMRFTVSSALKKISKKICRKKLREKDPLKTATPHPNELDEGVRSQSKHSEGSPIFGIPRILKQG